jgi:hypothetical protein
MIINGGSRSNGAFFAKHLTNGEHNERVTLCEMRNLAAENIPDAFREMAAVAMGTLCKNYFYHANINPREAEILTQEQWQFAADLLEKNLGLETNARFVVEHKKEGRTHRHVIWSRIDVANMIAAVMADDYEKHQATARALEKAFALQRVQSVSGRSRASGPRPSRRPKTWESFRGQKSGIDPWEMKQRVTALYRGSSTGAVFSALLAQQGYTLIRGDRADFCIMDAAGHLHSLARRIDGIKAATLREFMSDIDRAALPNAASARPSAAT